MEIINRVKELATPIVESLDCKLCDVTFTKEGKDYYLRLFVDRKKEKIDLDVIVRISELLSEVLDKEDFIDMNYVLDISSLGAEHPIDVNSLNEYVGEYIHVHLSHPFLGMNDIEGTLSEINDTNCVIEYREKARVKKANLELCYIDKARLAIKF